MTRIKDLEDGKHPFILEHTPSAFSQDVPKHFKGECMMITCLEERAQSEVMDFAEIKSDGKRDWIFKLGFPKFTEGRFVWVLIR